MRFDSSLKEMKPYPGVERYFYKQCSLENDKSNFELKNGGTVGPDQRVTEHAQSKHNSLVQKVRTESETSSTLCTNVLKLQ